MSAEAAAYYQDLFQKCVPDRRMAGIQKQEKPVWRFLERRCIDGVLDVRA